MEQVMKQRDARQEKISQHAFFDWLRSDRVPVQDRLAFVPAGALFIMQFRDMSRWVLRFPEPRTEYEWVINLGTLEDEKHSRLFWRTGASSIWILGWGGAPATCCGGCSCRRIKRFSGAAESSLCGWPSMTATTR